MRAPEIYSFSKFSVFATVLVTVVIMLDIRALDLEPNFKNTFVPSLLGVTMVGINSN